MTQPTASERLLRRLAVLPDACRAIEAAIDRARIRGGGEVLVRLHVGREGELEAVEVPARFERRGIESMGGAT